MRAPGRGKCWVRAGPTCVPVEQTDSAAVEPAIALAVLLTVAVLLGHAFSSYATCLTDALSSTCRYIFGH